MKHLALPIIFFLFTMAVHAEEFGQRVINTGAVECTRDVVVFQQTWVNPQPFPIRIVRSQLWIGADKDIVADIAVAARRTSDNNLINEFPWDRYENPTGKHHNTQANDLWIAPGDGIVLTWLCAWYNQEPGIKHAAFELNVWWVKRGKL